MENKSINCVEMKHRAAIKIQNKLRGFTRKERLSYWNKRYQQMKTKVEKRMNITK